MRNSVWRVYSKFKLHFYLDVLGQFQEREASLTTVETYCMEIIHALGTPTINEFASFCHISPPNAAYKVASLIRKGHLKKVRNEEDKREYHLHPTEKFIAYYNLASGYVTTVVDRMKVRFPQEDCEKFMEMMDIIHEELMPEVQITK